MTSAAKERIFCWYFENNIEGPLYGGGFNRVNNRDELP
jgi:hypothetical protein